MVVNKYSFFWPGDLHRFSFKCLIVPNCAIIDFEHKGRQQKCENGTVFLQTIHFPLFKLWQYDYCVQLTEKLLVICLPGQEVRIPTLYYRLYFIFKQNKSKIQCKQKLGDRKQDHLYCQLYILVCKNGFTMYISYKYVIVFYIHCE